jgi:hypothetical protein
MEYAMIFRSQHGPVCQEGKWEFAGKTKIGGKLLDKYRAMFIWFSGPLSAFGDPANPAFIGSIRPRFVTFFDKDNPDQMRGYIQPYLYRYTSASHEHFPGAGIGQVNFDDSGSFPSRIQQIRCRRRATLIPIPTTIQSVSGPCISTSVEYRHISLL